jgi:hypothetical protein
MYVSKSDLTETSSVLSHYMDILVTTTRRSLSDTNIVLSRQSIWQQLARKRRFTRCASTARGLNRETIQRTPSVHAKIVN